MKDVVPSDRIEGRILELRGLKVMLDSDLADLYAVETRVLNQAVKRNADRFPEDFVFRLSVDEAIPLRSQNVTSSWGGRRTLPYAFTEHGILMLSNVLKSEHAVTVSLQIIRVFVKLRALAQGYHQLAERIQRIERRQDAESRAIWNAIRLLEKTIVK